ncbi:MAG: hypothetical protein L6R39_001460 [Caloplaca ligustica]|nr:MAG: hypothetical protein L6R39_001460 [Caloplaca ligustica]
MTSLRRNFGIGEPVRRGMELKIAREGEWRPMALGGSAGVSGDILMGKDAEITWEDVFKGDETRENADFHVEMEKKLKMDCQQTPGTYAISRIQAFKLPSELPKTPTTTAPAQAASDLA